MANSKALKKLKTMIVQYETVYTKLLKLFTEDDGQIDANEAEKLNQIRTYIDKIKNKIQKDTPKEELDVNETSINNEEKESFLDKVIDTVVPEETQENIRAMIEEVQSFISDLQKKRKAGIELTA